MPEQTPRDLELITVIEFTDGRNHYLQSWKGQLLFKEGEIISLKGNTLQSNLGISECRIGDYIITSVMPKNQLDLRSDKKDICYRFYTANRIEGRM